MICQLCGKKIGPFRRLVDREFCSAAHRHEARTTIDRTLADIDDDNHTDEPWAVTKSRTNRSNPSAQTASVLLLVVAGVLILATLSFSGNGGGGSSFAISAPSTRPADTSSWASRIGNSIGQTIRTNTRATWRDDFRTGVSDWLAAGAHAVRADGSGDWSVTASGLKPGRLRIWKPSSTLSNYEFDFLGQIDKKSMGWAYRALDNGNYYGTKLTILRPGPGPNAGLVRWIVLNGHEVDRVQLPIPLSIAAGENYRVRVNVRDDRFVTSVNGQVISSWSDHRLRRGGIGFLSDEGESATLKWVSLSERDSLVGRVLSHFSLIQLPLSQLPE